MVCAQARLAQTASCFLEASEARRSWSRAEERGLGGLSGQAASSRPEPQRRRKFPRSAWGESGVRAGGAARRRAGAKAPPAHPGNPAHPGDARPEALSHGRARPLG